MPIQYNPAPSDKRFQIPRTLKSDFDNFLNYDIPGYVMDFEKIRDWYDVEEEQTEGAAKGLDDFILDTDVLGGPRVDVGEFKQVSQTIRGMIYPDTAKSRYSNTDNNLNMRFSLDDDVIKGDIVIDPDGTIYLLDWQIAPQHNNKTSRAVRCNAIVTFTRPCQLSSDDKGYQVDDLGYVIEPEQTAIEQDDIMVKVIANDMPINAVRYDGRPQFSATSHTPGVIPNALSIILVQYNKKTKNIQIDDEFIYGKDVFIVVDIDYVGMNIKGDHGVLRLQCRKKAGGYVG